LRLGLKTDLFDVTIDRLQQQGAHLPASTEWGIVAVVADPEGRKLEFYDKG
jgi:hypothetical protein